jgi:hypothetical protein
MGNSEAHAIFGAIGVTRRSFDKLWGPSLLFLDRDNVDPRLTHVYNGLRCVIKSRRADERGNSHNVARRLPKRPVLIYSRVNCSCIPRSDTFTLARYWIQVNASFLTAPKRLDSQFVYCPRR